MNFIRLAAAVAVGMGLSACGSGVGGVLGNLNPISTLQCAPGTAVQLANPQPNQAGVPGNIGQIVIVASGQSNTLYNTYGQWNLTLTSQSGYTINGGNLTLTSYPNGPHPYASDFYYASSIGSLPSGMTWSVQLNEPGANCTGVPLNSFST